MLQAVHGRVIRLRDYLIGRRAKNANWLVLLSIFNQFFSLSEPVTQQFARKKWIG
jgi:hypothetical protein